MVSAAWAGTDRSPSVWVTAGAEPAGAAADGAMRRARANRLSPTKAQAIIDYRNRYGGFTCIEEITEVKGIGEKTFEKIRDQIYINN